MADGEFTSAQPYYEINLGYEPEDFINKGDLEYEQETDL